MSSSLDVSTGAIVIHSQCDDKCCVWWSLKLALFGARHRCPCSAVPHLSSWLCRDFWKVRVGQLMPLSLWFLSKPVLFKVKSFASAMQMDSLSPELFKQIHSLVFFFFKAAAKDKNFWCKKGGKVRNFTFMFWRLHCKDKPTDDNICSPKSFNQN